MIAVQAGLCLLVCHWRTRRWHQCLTWQCEWGQQMVEIQHIHGSIRSFPFVVGCVSYGAGSGWSSEVLVLWVQGRYHCLWLKNVIVIILVICNEWGCITLLLDRLLRVFGFFNESGWWVAEVCCRSSLEGYSRAQNCQKFGVHLGLGEIEWGWLWQRVLSQRQGLSWSLCQKRHGRWLQCNGDVQESKLANQWSFLGIQ